MGEGEKGLDIEMVKYYKKIYIWYYKKLCGVYLLIKIIVIIEKKKFVKKEIIIKLKDIVFCIFFF